MTHQTNRKPPHQNSGRFLGNSFDEESFVEQILHLKSSGEICCGKKTCLTKLKAQVLKFLHVLYPISAVCRHLTSAIGRLGALL